MGRDKAPIIAEGPKGTCRANGRFDKGRPLFPRPYKLSNVRPGRLVTLYL